MRFALLPATAAVVATASALKSAVQLNKEFKPSAAHARVINRCDYPVNIWSTIKGRIGCDDSEMVTLKKGEIYGENYQYPKEAGEGVSIKISKTEKCTGSNIVQLEYFIENRKGKEEWHNNYLDVSYVDCLGGDCPTKKEGYYLRAGNDDAHTAKATADGSWCPRLSCSDPESCAKLSYILPDDVATKTCDPESSMDFYLCGSEAPSDDDEEPAYSAPAPESSKPAESSKQVESPAPEPSTTLVPVVSSVEIQKANVAAITAAPQADEDKAPKVKTKVVYVTAYEYVNAKRHEHAHAHGRRHKEFHA